MSELKENKIEQLSPEEHILKRSGMYLGAIVPTKYSTFMLDRKTEKFSYQEVEFVPGFCKIINEILDNSIDEFARTNGKYATNISLDIDRETGTIRITDDGRGIPLKEVGNTGKSGLEVSLTNLMAGSNFRDDENGRKSLGMNGMGSVISVVFSKFFQAVVYDGKQKGVLTCRNNLTEKECIITDEKSKKTGTSVEFIPDLKRFGMRKIDQIHSDLIHQRMMFLSVTYPEIKFKFNGEPVKFKNIKNFMSCFADKFVVEEDQGSPSKYLIGVIPNETDEFCHESFINGAHCVLGGNHLDYIHSELVGRIKEKLSRKYPSIKPGDIKNRLAYVVNFREFINPMFNSQTKENFSSSAGEVKEFLKNIDWDSFTERICKCKEIIEPITEAFRIKEELQKQKTLEKIGTVPKKFKCKKFLPATERNKWFLICEGDCLEKNTEIFNLSENSSMKISDIEVGDLVLTHKQNIKPVISKSEKLIKCFKIKTKSGKEIECSADHRFFVYDTESNTFKWKKLKNINKNTDKLVSNKLACNFALEELKIEQIENKKYKFKIYGESFLYMSSPNHYFLVFNIELNSFERIKTKDINPDIHMMCLIKKEKENLKYN